MFAAPTATQTVQDPVQAQSLAEPGVFEGFDRSGQGIAQRRRATLLAASSVQRKVAQREMDATRGSGKLSAKGEEKLGQVMNTMNAMPFDEEFEVAVDTAELPRRTPIVVKMPTESAEPIRFTIRSDFVETRSVEEILAQCRKQLGLVVLPGLKKVAATQEVPKEDVFLSKGDKLGQDGKPVGKALQAKLFEFLFTSELAVAELTKSKVADGSSTMLQAMQARLKRLRDEQGDKHPWLMSIALDANAPVEVEKRLKQRSSR